jgi:hypothetical protein
MVTWLIRRYGTTAVPGVERRAAQALDLGRFTRQIGVVRLHLGALAEHVNARRRQAGRPAIGAGALDRDARRLVEEAQVFAESEVFQQLLQVETQRGKPGVYRLTQQYGAVNATMVDRYIFDHSPAFAPEDREGRTEDERRILQILTEILEGMFQLQVRRRFSLAAYLPSSPPLRPRYEPPELETPRLIERIDDPTRRRGF